MRTAAVGSILKAVGRQMFLGALAVATAVLGLALLLAAVTTGGDAIAMPEFVSGRSESRPDGPSIVATGYGEASAPAETATIQMVLFKEYGMVPSDDDATDDVVAGQEATAAPVAQAITALGVSGDDIAVVTSPTFMQMYGGPGSSGGVVRLDITLLNPTVERVGEIVRAASAAGREDNTMLQGVGVSYAVADCAPLQLQARQRATEQARIQAQQQADVLSVKLGPIRLASDEAVSTATGAPLVGGCAPATGAGNGGLPPYFMGYDSSAYIDVPAYNPTSPAEARAVAQVSLTYEITAP